MSYPKKLLEDTFEFEQTPFLVKVEERDMFVNPRDGRICGVNINGSPTCLGPRERASRRKWVICKAHVARVRPDYPYTIKKEWPDNVDQHFQAIELLEKPEKGWFFYSTKEREPQRDRQELAKAAIAKLKKAYEEREEVAKLK